VITENLLTFFADFGEDGTLAGTGVRGIFDAPNADMPGDGVGMANNEPSFLMRSADVPSAAYTTTADVQLVLTAGAAVRGAGFPATYNVVAVQPDGTGLTRLILREA
jgi:hypothetical protein